jgi:predicted  nucleic acid-binding Zn-ribbon protein
MPTQTQDLPANAPRVRGADTSDGVATMSASEKLDARIEEIDAKLKELAPDLSEAQERVTSLRRKRKLLRDERLGLVKAREVLDRDES